MDELVIAKIKIAVLAFTIICQSVFFNTVSASNESASKSKMFIVTKNQSGSEIRVKPGEIIRIELQTLGSAGYSWYINKIDRQYLELISEETTQNSEDAKVGAPILMTWQFKAKKQGSTKIEMDNYRKWEGIEKSVDHFILKINISDKGGSSYEKSIIT